MLLNRAAKAIAEGKTNSLKAAMAIAQDGSNTMRRDLVWPDIAESLRDVLTNHRNEIQWDRWKDNYMPFITEALRLIEAGQVSDGQSHLKGTKAKWVGKAPSRGMCCQALRNLTDHAIARFGSAKSWQIAAMDIKELRGKSLNKCRKATLSETELLCLIDAIASRNPRRGQRR